MRASLNKLANTLLGFPETTQIKWLILLKFN